MSDPGSYMSPEAVLVMAVVVVVLLVGWLAGVFHAARQPVTEPALPGLESAGHAAEPGADPHGQTAPGERSAGKLA